MPLWPVPNLGYACLDPVSTWFHHPNTFSCLIECECVYIPVVVVPPRPVPNLGYACLNSTLQLQKPPVTSNRGAILRTFEEKGLPHISQLALQNCKDLLPIIQWNHEHNIRLFRCSELICCLTCTPVDGSVAKLLVKLEAHDPAAFNEVTWFAACIHAVQC